MSAIDVVGQYGAAMAAGDMEALAATFHPDAVWHQPGANQVSGDHVGPDAILAHLGRFMQLSGGTSSVMLCAHWPSGCSSLRYSISRSNPVPPYCSSSLHRATR